MKSKIVICTLVLMFSVFAGSVFGGTEGPDSTAYGSGAGYSTSYLYNTFVGNFAGFNNEGYHNTFVGYQGGYNKTTGYNNTFVGSKAGYGQTAGGGGGGGNTFLGMSAGANNDTGSNNTFVGLDAGASNRSGNGNVFLGIDAGFNETGSNKLYISNSDTSAPLIYGEFDNSIVGINGKLGIGTQAPVRGVHLAGSNAVFRMDRTADTAAFQIVRTDGSGNPMKVFVVGVNASGTGTGEFIINDNGTALSGALNRRMTIANDGSVTFTGNVTAHTYYSSSSLTLKDNVRTYENALDTVNRLRGVSFDWKDSGQPSVGLIAEEVAKVVPEVVAYDGGAATGVNYASLVGVLVEAVKEQQAELGSLKGKQMEVDSLKMEVDSLKSEMQQLKALLQGR